MCIIALSILSHTALPKYIHRGSYMSARVSLNLFNMLGEKC